MYPTHLLPPYPALGPWDPDGHVLFARKNENQFQPVVKDPLTVVIKVEDPLKNFYAMSAKIFDEQRIREANSRNFMDNMRKYREKQEKFLERGDM